MLGMKSCLSVNVSQISQLSVDVRVGVGIPAWVGMIRELGITEKGLYVLQRLSWCVEVYCNLNVGVLICEVVLKFQDSLSGPSVCNLQEGW